MGVHPLEKSVSLGTGAEPGWLALHAAPRSAAAVRQVRYAFDMLLRRKASDPKELLGPEDRAVIAAYVAIINSVETDSKERR